MDRINFSMDYAKLHGQRNAELIAVRRIRIDKDTPEQLIEYDTVSSDGKNHYKLNNGNHLQLVFLGNYGIPFCTIRSDKPAISGQKAKYDYYAEKIGNSFELVIQGSTKHER